MMNRENLRLFYNEDSWITQYLKQTENDELIKLLSFCKEDAIFFDTETRLLSVDEILKSKEEFKLEKDIIPIIDLYNNIFVGFDINNNEFVKIDISEEVVFERLDTIEKYIDKLNQYHRENNIEKK